MRNESGSINRPPMNFTPTKCIRITSLAVALFVSLPNCKPESSTHIQREAFELSDSTLVADMLTHASQVATSGAESCTFRFTDSAAVTLEFPLLDGNRKHWQFKAIKEVDVQQYDLATQATSDALVIFASCGKEGWSLGKASVSERDLEQQVRAHSATRHRTVLIIRAASELPAKRLAHIWGVAQSVGVCVLIYELKPTPAKL